MNSASEYLFSSIYLILQIEAIKYLYVQLKIIYIVIKSYKSCHFVWILLIIARYSISSTLYFHTR